MSKWSYGKLLSSFHPNDYITWVSAHSKKTLSTQLYKTALLLAVISYADKAVGHGVSA
jgi:hypothetical protein